MGYFKDRNHKIAVAHSLKSKGGFASKIGEALLLADNVNEERVVAAFPEYFIEHKAKLRLVYDGRYNHLLER
jgi:predicted dinucleotide-binding enzyme